MYREIEHATIMSENSVNDRQKGRQRTEEKDNQ